MSELTSITFEALPSLSEYADGSTTVGSSPIPDSGVCIPTLTEDELLELGELEPDEHMDDEPDDFDGLFELVQEQAFAWQLSEDAHASCHYLSHRPL